MAINPLLYFVRNVSQKNEDDFLDSFFDGTATKKLLSRVLDNPHDLRYYMSHERVLQRSYR